MILFLYILGIILILNNLGTVLFSLIYSCIIYPKQIKPFLKISEDVLVGVFVPCKGIDDNMENNFRAFMDQDYKNFRVTFITESNEDPAVEVIKKVMKDYKNAYHVVSGRTQYCCQKNHNLLKGIKSDNDSKVIVIADADVCPSNVWLKNIILPIMNDFNHVSTGFRWLDPYKASFFGTIHSMLNSYLFCLMPATKGVWGGSIAIKREDFIKYAVAEKWASSVVDDISLTQLIIKNNLKRVFVSECITYSRSVISCPKELIDWFTRQIMFLKIYCGNLWVIAIIIHAVSLMYFLFCLYDVIFLRINFDFSLLFIILNVLSNAIQKYNYRDRQNIILWIFLSVPAMIMGNICLINSVIQKSIIWRNIRYDINSDGSVGKVTFLK